MVTGASTLRRWGVSQGAARRWGVGTQTFGVWPRREGVHEHKQINVSVPDHNKQTGDSRAAPHAPHARARGTLVVIKF